MKKYKTKKRILLVAKGKISGTYADGFHKVSEDGKIGYSLDRLPSEEEKMQILADLKRHKKSLLDELSELKQVEKLLAKC